MTAADALVSAPLSRWCVASPAVAVLTRMEQENPRFRWRETGLEWRTHHATHSDDDGRCPIRDFSDCSDFDNNDRAVLCGAGSFDEEMHGDFFETDVQHDSGRW